MGINNGDIAEKTINLIITAPRLTADVLKNAMQQYLAGACTKRGKVSLKQLAKGGKVEGIEISKANIADFRRTAAKYDIQYALSKCPDKSAYYVMFSSSKAQNIEKAFREYASGKVRNSDKQLFQGKVRSSSVKRLPNFPSRISSAVSREHRRKKRSLRGSRLG